MTELMALLNAIASVATSVAWLAVAIMVLVIVVDYLRKG